MHEQPPKELVQVLEQLGLCTTRQVLGVRRRVHRLARDLPAFDQVWIDALVQARQITPFQAGVLADNHAQRLRVGPYLLIDRLGRSDLGETFRARPLKGGPEVALKVLDPHVAPPDQATAAIEQLGEKLRSARSRHLALPETWGTDQMRCWIASRYVPGPNCAELLIHQGRIQPTLVMELARHMLKGLAALAACSQVHGDLRPSHVRLSLHGHAVLSDGGVRLALPAASLVPTRSLPPERFDYLAPEFFGSGRPDTLAGDLYALGCVLWQLLTGRPPFRGAEPVAKLAARRKGPPADVRELSPETPAALAQLITSLTQEEPARRPSDVGELLGSLGSTSGRIRRQLGVLSRTYRRRWSPRGPMPRVVRWMGAVAMVLLTASVSVGLARRPESGLQFDALSRLINFIQPAPVAVSETEPFVERAKGESEHLLRAEHLYLQPHQRISGRPEQPLVILIGSACFEITVPGVEFEHVRFVPVQGANRPTAHRQDSLIRVRGTGTRFRGCSFEVGEHWGSVAIVSVATPDCAFERCLFVGPNGFEDVRPDTAPPALSWRYRTSQRSSGVIQPVAAVVDSSQSSDRSHMLLQQCRFQDVSAAIEYLSSMPLQATLEDCVHSGPGPLVRLGLTGQEVPGRVRVQMVRCTVSECPTVLTVNYAAQSENWPGCEFVVHDSTLRLQGSSTTGDVMSLVKFRGPVVPDRLVGRIRWTGHGSTVEVSGPPLVAVWEPGTGVARSLPDQLIQQLHVEGLVLGDRAPRKVLGPEDR